MERVSVSLRVPQNAVSHVTHALMTKKQNVTTKRDSMKLCDVKKITVEIIFILREGIL